MPTCAVAVAACCYFVFYPAGPAFNAGYHVFGGGTVEAHLNGGAAPNAFIAVALQNEGHALAAVQLAFMVALGAIFTGHKNQIKGVTAVFRRGLAGCGLYVPRNWALSRALLGRV